MSLFDQILMGVIFGGFVVAFAFVFLLRRKRWSLTFVGVSLLVSSGGLFVALASQFHVALFGDDAEGRIVDTHWERRNSYVIVRYTTPAGNDVDFRCRQGVSRGNYKVDELVPVRYLPTDPTHATIANRESMYQPLIIGALFSSALLFGAALILWKQTTRPARGS